MTAAGKRTLLMALLTVLAMAAITPRAHGQAGPPTPTAVAPTPTPAAPAPAVLIGEMQRAIKRAGSAHLSVVASVRVKKLIATRPELRGDYSWRNSKLRLKGTATSTDLTQTASSQQVMQVVGVGVGKRSAWRNNGESWTCGTERPALDRTTFIGFTNPSAASAQILGADTVNGVPVWHAQLKVKDPLQLSKAVVLADVYISQSDFTVVRETVSATVTDTENTREGLSVDYTNYGQVVSIKLPKTCRAG